MKQQNPTRSLVIDGLNIGELTPEQMKRTLEGGIGAINLTSVRPGAGLHDALLQIEKARAAVRDMPQYAMIVRTVDDILKAHANGVVGVILGAQNSLMVEPDVKLLAAFHSLGMRIMQPTYNERNAFGYGASYSTTGDRGITEAGRAWLSTAEELGILVDLSHCGPNTGLDFIAAAKRPLVFSHGNAFALCPSPRNKSDEAIRAVAGVGGLIGAVTWSPLVRHDRRPTLDDYLDHMEHLIKVGGIEHVGFASDLPEILEEDPVAWNKTWGHQGIYPNITGVLGEWYAPDTETTAGLQSISQVGRVWDGMRKRGYRESDLEKVMSGNWLRILREIWRD